jgi:hypothetical protein
MAKLVQSTRGSITLDIDGAIIEFQGEAYLPGPKSPDFVAYSNSVRNKGTGQKLSGDALQDCLSELRQWAIDHGWNLEIE